MLLDGKNGNLINNLNNIYTEIKSAGISITEYLNRVDAKHNDIISFILLASKPDISGDPNKPSAYEDVCIKLIKTLLLYGYNSAVNHNLPIHTAIRVKSLPMVKAFFEGKAKAKFTPDIEQEADQVNDPAISEYIESVKTGKTTTNTKADIGKIDFAKYGLYPKLTTHQKLTHDNALALLQELATVASMPLDAKKIDTFKKNKSALQTTLVATLQKIGKTHNISIS
jgi:hypothetical protein